MFATTIVALQFALQPSVLLLLPLLILLLAPLDGIHIPSIGIPLDLRVAPLSIFVLFLTFVPFLVLRPCLRLTCWMEHFHP